MRLKERRKKAWLILRMHEFEMHWDGIFPFHKVITAEQMHFMVALSHKFANIFLSR